MDRVELRRDRIELRGLRLAAIVGVLPEERERAQPIEFDLDLHLSLTGPSETDALADTVDYGAVCDAVIDVAAGARPQLLERLAGVVAEQILGIDPRIDTVVVAVRKLRPPVPHVLDSSGVRIVRERRR